MNWKEYQNEVSKIFHDVGCDSVVEAVVEGVRGKHKVDVLVSFEQFGVTCKWVIECKLWNSNIPKEKVLALKSIVDDVGADKGILVSEVGFQSGAIQMSNRSNIMLTSLDDLKTYLEQPTEKRIIEDLERELLHLIESFCQLSQSETNGNYSYGTRVPKGVNGKEFSNHFAALHTLKDGFSNIKIGKSLFNLKLQDDFTYETTSSLATYVTAVKYQTLASLEWLNGVTAKL